MWRFVSNLCSPSIWLMALLLVVGFRLAQGSLCCKAGFLRWYVFSSDFKSWAC